MTKLLGYLLTLIALTVMATTLLTLTLLISPSYTKTKIDPSNFPDPPQHINVFP